MYSCIVQFARLDCLDLKSLPFYNGKQKLHACQALGKQNQPSQTVKWDFKYVLTLLCIDLVIQHMSRVALVRSSYSCTSWVYVWNVLRDAESNERDKLTDSKKQVAGIRSELRQIDEVWVG